MKQKNIKKEVAIGIIIGFIATSIGFFIYTEFFLGYSFEILIKLNKSENIIGSILAYSVIPNALAFYVFIKKQQDYRARGVLIATFVVAIAILVSKFY
jgi:phosphoglycerol transferase MdoB-like AlkP superfamily enzyme